MKKLLTSACAAIAVASIVSVYGVRQISPAAAAFPALTTIYYAVGVFDGGGAAGSGTATSVSCSNLSGQTAKVRWLVYSEVGSLAGSAIRDLPNRQSHTVSTHGVFLFGDEGLPGGAILDGGTIAVQSTRSAVFCTAMIVNAAASTISGIELHMVRYNAHPGTVE